MITEINEIAHRAYRFHHTREGRRAVIFMARAMLHWGELRELYDFFQKTEARKELYARNPFPLEQATRAFFYAGSTVRSRIALIEAHYTFLESCLATADFIELGFNQEREIWRSSELGITWRSYLKFESGQRKEGLLSVMMDVDDLFARFIRLFYFFLVVCGTFECIILIPIGILRQCSL